MRSPRFAFVFRSIVLVVFEALVADPLSAITGPARANATISQIYGGGGNAGALYINDFVELHNPSVNAITVTGWAIQYASATGGTWTVASMPTMAISPGGYILVKLASGGANGVPLPGFEASDTSLNLSATAGKVALTNTTTPLSGTCPAGAQIQDMVGYGGTANCFEGAGAAPTPSNTAGVKHIVDGCGDTNANNTDFGAVTPAPRTSLSDRNFCEATVNETNTDEEIDHCVLQYPLSITVVTGTAVPNIYARVYQSGLTEASGPSPSITAQIGYGFVDPAVLSGTTWFPASFNTQYGNDDEYQASFTAPEQGNYIYTARFSLDGVNWTYCDSNGAGSNPGHEYSNQDLTYMLVTVPVGAPGEPRSLTATGGNQQVNLSWMAPTKPGFSPITGYQAQVATSSGGPFINAPGCTIDGTTTNCIATGLTNGTTFFFRVAAKNDYGFGEYSNRPSATPSALFFSDDPIAQGISIKVAHVLELRNAITFTRQTFGLLASGYTDTLVAGSTPIKAVHITELRLALRDVYMQRGMVPPTYTDPVLTTSTPIKAVHINQIRAAILAAQ